MTQKLTAAAAEKKLLGLKDPDRGIFSQRFFKTGKGEYAEGDKFLGIPVPETRKLSREFKDLPFEETIILLRSPYHESRLLALFILVLSFRKASEEDRKKIYRAYLANTNHINNWDLVDSSAEHIVGAYLFEKDHSILKKLAGSKSLWERRIAMLACFHFIRKKEFSTALEIAKLLLNDKHDLIHKAVGWMLREIGERDPGTEIKFLDRHYAAMPRTMLRYAIEKFKPVLREGYMKGLR